MIDIKKVLADRNLSEVARKTGISRMALHNWVHGKAKPSFKSLEKIEAYLRGLE